MTVPWHGASQTAGSEGSSFELIGEHPDGRLTLRFVGGVLAGRCVTAFPDNQCTFLHPHPLTPQQKADQLLRSLLDAEQRNSWHIKRRFRIETPYGVLQLGAMHNMRFWLRAERRELNLCVVPTGDLGGLPEADIWTNLLLVVRAEPERFFSVANWRQAGERQWHRPPAAGLELVA
jgi:hypothetical protein